MTMQVTTNGKGNHLEQPAPANGADVKPLPFTGERFVEGSGVEITYDHWVRYHFARQFAAGARVLDVASGEGYGSALLAAVAARVDGFDADAAAVAHARRKYGAAGVNYSCATTDEFFRRAEAASYDFVTCFEFIEHVDDAGQKHLLEGIRKVLTPGGLAVISTPDRKLYSDETQHRNEFHIRELYRDEFQTLLQRHFPHVQLFDQATFTGSAVIRSGATSADLVQIKWKDIIRLLGKAEQGVELAGKYVVAIVSNSPISDTAVRSALLVDPERKLVGEEVYSLQTRLDAMLQKHGELEERAKSSETALRLRNAAPPATPAPATPSSSTVGRELERLQARELELLSQVDHLRRQVLELSNSIGASAPVTTAAGADRETELALRLKATVEPIAALLNHSTTELAELRSRLALAEARALDATESLAVHEKLAENVLRLVEKKQKEVERLARAESDAIHAQQLLHHARYELQLERERRTYLENMLSMKMIQKVKPLWDRVPVVRDSAKLAARVAAKVLRRGR